MRRTQLSTAIRLPATGCLTLCLLLGGISLTACTGSIPVDGNRAEEVEKADETADTEECSEEESQVRSGRSSAWGDPHDLLTQQADEKPVIYLYPNETTDVTVSVEHPERLTCTYPETDGSWSVVAEPDGTLTDESTGRKLYALYYEVEVPAGQVGDEGFVVERNEIAPFLEKKLAILGLTEREAEEMIIYWLPKMQAYDRCLVRFSLTDEEQEINRLDISPTPDHLIRIRMVWKGYDDGDKMPSVTEQKLETVKRESLDGFVAVEWGGTEKRPRTCRLRVSDLQAMVDKRTT